MNDQVEKNAFLPFKTYFNKNIPTYKNMEKL